MIRADLGLCVLRINCLHFEPRMVYIKIKDVFGCAGVPQRIYLNSKTHSQLRDCQRTKPS